MKRFFLIFVTLISMSPIYAQYSKQWEQVSSFEKQSLPKSALEVVNQIYQDAIKNNNSVELIKAIIYQLKFETAIDKDKYPEMIKEIEAFAEKDNNKTGQAVLYSLLAEIYKNYYFMASPESTAISGYIPEDIREWPANLFIQKIANLIDLSLVPAKELQQTSALEYREILKEGKSSRDLRPTLYDFLINGGIATLTDLNNNYKTQNYYTQTKLTDKACFSPVKEFIQLNIKDIEKYDFAPKILQLYQQLLTFRSQYNNPQAQLVVDLDRLDFVKNNYKGESAEKLYKNAIEDLKNQFKSHDYVVEILYREAYAYLNSTSYTGNESYNENIKKAYEICQQGIKQYPEYERIGLLENFSNNLTSSQLSVSANNVVYPGEDLSLKINSKNFNKVHIEIYRINAPVSVYMNNWTRNGQYLKAGTLIKKQTVALVNRAPYLSTDTIINIPMQEMGNYEYVIKTEQYNGEPANQQFSVSRLGTITHPVEDKREFLVVDRISGKPIENAKVNLYTRDDQILQFNKSFATDKMGLAQDIGEEKIAAYNVTKEDDEFLVVSNTPWLSTNNNQEKNTYGLSLFTDRSIYRPGQTIYFKGIAYETGEKQKNVSPNKKYTITFRDTNSKEISNQDFVTNEYGSFSGEFTIPQGVLTGFFTIQSDKDNGSVSVKVEEYKRPTFDIYFDENKNTYSFGDKVTIKGSVKTFSGVNLQDAEVRYRISRKTHWLYRGFFNSPVQVAQDNIKTDTDGNFEISFIAEKSFDDRNNKNTFYLYEIEAIVTNTNGENQTSSTYFNLGDKSMYLSFFNLENVLDKDNPSSIRIDAMNLSREKIEGSGSYEIYELNITDKKKLDGEDDNWTQGKVMFTGTFKSGESIDKMGIQKLPSGKYRIIAKAKDQQNREVEAQKDFILASKDDKQPPVPTYKWVMKPKTICEPGENAEIILGSTADNVYVLYELYKDNKKLSASRFVLNNENRKIEIPFLESYGEGIIATFTYVKDKKVFTESVEIRKKEKDKSLILNMEVFRDRLLPGQKEEWKISVKEENESLALAEVLAGMYDASLDKIYSDPWKFDPVKPFYLERIFTQSGNEFKTSSGWLNYSKENVDVPNFKYDSFNWFGFNPRSYILYGNATRGTAPFAMRRMSTKELESLQIASLDEALEGSIAGLDIVGGGLGNEVIVTRKVMQADGALSIPEVSGRGNTMDNEILIRQNFNETAFFYPQLKTNEAGETLISFTVPESNTTWKFRALAHTKDLKYGQLVKEAISQKKLMVSPNVPRFIREGDKITISSNISNLSEENLSGNVTIEFFDPETDTNQIKITEASKTFSLEPGKTTPVSWSFDVPSGIELTTFKIVAQSATFSDGEQHLIPVLPNRMLVTESLPLSIVGKQKKEFVFDKLLKNSSPTLDNYRLTLEFAGNPTWYAIQALPSISVPQNENVLSWFGTYYSNTMAAYIANSTPKIKQIIDMWTKQGASKETLLSNLEKNQELKNVLLEETPWVMEAKDETEQKQRLSLLFDLNRTANLNNQAIEKLISMQSPDGGWMWFKGLGGRSNASITQWILYCLGELSQLEGYLKTEEIAQMESLAVSFIDKTFSERYEDLKKNNKNWKKKKDISSYELEYLYTRSYYGDTISSNLREAIDFYIDLTKNYWSNTSKLYDRAVAALVMEKYGNKNIAQNIIQSLREHATHNPDLGMYWANNNTYSFMTQSATCAHTFIMKAFLETGAGSQEMDKMKLWLLKQKQTQIWESVPATVLSINALVNTGSDWLSNQGNTQIKLGKQTVDSKEAISGTGYIKKVYDSKTIKPDMAKISVSKSDEGSAWGALYWQYFENLDKISGAKTNLNVQKELYVEKITNTGKTLIPISEKNPLKVGDKVTVRLTIRSDRDMEFVHLKDMHASCFEPVDQLSGNQWKQGIMYYQAPKDASMNFYFAAMPKGTYVLEYNLYTTSTGNYSNGISTIQCMYAPEYTSHTSGGRVTVEQ